MKHLISTCLVVILFNQTFAQKNCKPASEVFGLFQKKQASFSIGIGGLKNQSSQNKYSFFSQVGFNYYPINYLEIGTKLRPIIVNPDNYRKSVLVERSAHLRYYAYRIRCYKTTVFGQVGIYRDGSFFSPEGKEVNSEKMYSAFSFGLNFLPKRNLQIELYSDIFFNKDIRTNLSLNWHFLHIRTKNKKQ